MKPETKRLLTALLDRPITAVTVMNVTQMGMLVYSRLRELEFKGLVRSWDVDEALEERGGRPRRYYAITPEGREALKGATE